MNDNIFNKMNREVGQKVALDPTPEKAANHFYKIQVQQSIFTEAPQTDVARTTPITDLIAAKRHLDTATNTLNQTRKIMTEWNDDSRAKWEETKKKEIELRESIIHFNHFVAENHEKRERAKDKIKNEIAIQGKREQEIREAESKVKYLQTIEKDLGSKVVEYQIYKDFLTEVAKKNDDLSDIQDVLNRYGTLAATRGILGNQQSTALASVQTAREHLANQAENQARNMMGLQTQLAQLRVRLGNARKLRQKWKAILSHVRSFAAEKAVEIEQVRNSCWDMYKKLCKLRKEPITLAEADTEQQLVYITRRNQELLKVAKMIKDKMEKGGPETNVNVVTSTLH